MVVQVFPPSPGNFGSSTSPFGTENVSTSTATATITLTPPGFYIIVTGAQNLVQYSPNSGGLWRTLVAASTTELIWSDGQNMRIYNTSTGGTTTFYTQILGPV